MLSLLDRYAPVVLGLGSALLIGGALVGQYGFDLYPCVLCLVQRQGHYAAMAAAVVAAILWRRGRLWLIPFLILVIGQLHSAGYGAFHTGVEQQWWQGTNACGGSFVETESIEERLKQLQQGGAARCDEIPFAFMGISMAGYNFLFSGSLGILGLLVIWRRRHQIIDSKNSE